MRFLNSMHNGLLKEINIKIHVIHMMNLFVGESTHKRIFFNNACVTQLVTKHMTKNLPLLLCMVIKFFLVNNYLLCNL